MREPHYKEIPDERDKMLANFRDSKLQAIELAHSETDIQLIADSITHPEAHNYHRWEGYKEIHWLLMGKLFARDLVLSKRKTVGEYQ